MTDADKAALLKLAHMNIGTTEERVLLGWIIVLAIENRFISDTERTDVHRLLQKYGPQLGL